MSKVEIAEMLYRGSENIDLMRRKIERVLSMIFGLVYDECDRKNWGLEGDCLGLLVLTIEGTYRIVWKIRVSRPTGGHYTMQAYICVGLHETLVFSTAGSPHIHVEDVQDIYESLDSFVGGMIKEFPQSLVYKLKFFTRAGEMEL